MQLKNLLHSRAACIALALSATTTAFTTGCANMATTATGGNLAGNTAAITGHVHGGNQPVSGATVQMYAVGTVYGTAGALLATTTSASDGFGSWSFTPGTSTTPNTTTNVYTCPSSTTPVYVIAKGGNTQGTGSSTNSAAVFVAPLGVCGSPTTYTDMSEVTTVATMAAMQQFFNPNTDSFGGGSTGAAVIAVKNAMGLVSNMVNLATGTALSSKTVTTPYGSALNMTNVSLTLTPDQAKINTLANILAACVNSATSTASNCNTLFTNATPPSVANTSLPSGTTAFVQATDVAQALYYMLANPTDGSSTKLGNLYTLPVAAGAPFSPTLGSQPSDWTIAITYSSTSVCATGSTTFGPYISSPSSLATDGSGNIWFTNAGSGNLSEIGVATYGPALITGGPWRCGPTSALPSSGAVASTVIDTNGNLWGTTNGTTPFPYLVRYNSTAFTSSESFQTTEPPVAIAADGNGNIYYSSATGKLYVLVNAASPLITTNNAVSDGGTPIATGLGSASSLVVDSYQAVWATTGGNSVLRISGGTPFAPANYTTTSFTTNTPTYGIGVSSTFGSNSTNNVFFSLQGTENSVGALTGVGTSYAAAANWPVASGAGGLSLPAGVAVDSRSNVWAANATNVGGLGSVSAFTSSGTALSSPTGDQKAITSLNNSQSVIVDISGDVWVGGSGNSFITEIVGAAVPVRQPAAVILNIDPHIGNATLLQTAP